MRRHVSLISVLAIGLAVGSAQAEIAKAVLTGTNPAIPVEGTVALQDTPAGLSVDVGITQAPAGLHAIHIHEFGLCSNEAKDAGSHFNPAGHPHGDMLKSGIMKTHAGDFGNITVDASGKGTLHAVVHGLTLSKGMYSVAGRAFVLHEKVDDFSQPTGNAGGRIGCGPIIISGK
jgi:Cu-Zn family superoxide dismutase